jgi:DivIVA domain-containing protein
MASGRGRRFAKGLIGYDIAEVDDFVERADQDLYWLQQEATRRRMQPGWAQYPPPGLLTPFELEQKDFGKTMRGYAMPEVDDYLDRVQDDYWQVLKELGLAPLYAGRVVGGRPPTALDIQNIQFDAALNGYDMPEVDAFLAQVARDLNWLQEEAYLRQVQPQAARTPPPGLLQAPDLEIRQFSKVVRGYNRPAVDSFLDRLSEEFRRLAQELGMARGRAYRRY